MRWIQNFKLVSANIIPVNLLFLFDNYKCRLSIKVFYFLFFFVVDAIGVTAPAVVRILLTPSLNNSMNFKQ